MEKLKRVFKVVYEWIFSRIGGSIAVIGGLITIASFAGITIDSFAGTTIAPFMDQGKALWSSLSAYVIPLMTLFLGVLLSIAYTRWKKIAPIHIISWKGYSEVTRAIGDTYHVVEYIKELVNIELLRLDGRHFQIAILDVERVYEIDQKYTLESLSSNPAICVFNKKDQISTIALANGHGKSMKFDIANYISSRLNQPDLLVRRQGMDLLAIPIRWGFSEILYHEEVKNVMLESANADARSEPSWELFELEWLKENLHGRMNNGHTFKIVILNWYFPVLLQLFAAKLKSKYPDIPLKFPLNRATLDDYQRKVQQSKGQEQDPHITTWIIDEIKEICDQIVALKHRGIIEFCPDFKMLSSKLAMNDNCCRIVFGAGGMVRHNENYQSLSTAENGGFFWAECAALPQKSHSNHDLSQIKKENVKKFVNYVGELLSTKNQITLSGFAEDDAYKTYYAIPISQAAMNKIGKDGRFERQFGRVTNNTEELVELQGLKSLIGTKHVENQYLWPRQVLEDIDDNIEIKREWERIWEDRIVPIIPPNER